jgi:ribosomal protein S18 acetylase RimI-like enzyme
VFASREATSADVRAMQEVAIQCWRHDRPLAHVHAGDLAWWTRQHGGREGEWRRGLWTFDGSPVAWAWLSVPDAEGELQVVPPHRERLVAEVAGWLFDRASECGAPAITLNAIDTDQATLRGLSDAGFADGTPSGYHHMLRRMEDPPTVAPVPEGFAVRHVAGEQDVERRVAVHRAAFSITRPSRVTVTSYRGAMAEWPYRAELDWVVEAPDGRFASACLTWLDAQNRVGLLEPVGTDPEFWRLGCARAVCTAALAALHRCGARTAVVGSVDLPDRPPARLLYESLGFETVARALRLSRAL